MLTITFTMLGDVVVKRAISRFGEDIADFRSVWSEVQVDFHEIERQQFKSEGGRGGGSWPPLSLRYALWKQRKYPGKPILNLTGELSRQLTTGAGMMIESDPMRLMLLPTVEYAYFHQQGTKKMPARKPIELQEEDAMGWIKMIQRYVVQKAREAESK